MLKLRLPEELLGERAKLEDPKGQTQEVRAIPLEKPLDPVLEEAVESQPEVRGGVSGGSGEASPNPVEEENADQNAKNGENAKAGHKSTPWGFLAALGAGVAVLIGVALGAKGGISGSGSGTYTGGDAPRGPASGPRLWE